MRIVITGFRGTGKTQTGRLLSRLLGVPFIDTDLLIEEKAGMPVYRIFSEQGEAHFRALEREVISCLNPGDAVIATGGGAILDPGNVCRLRQGSAMFLLQADEKTIEKRIADTERPPLTKLALREEIHELLQRRKAAYLAAADFCIDTTTRSANEAALIIQRMLSEGTTSLKDRERGLSFISSTGLGRDEARRLEEVLTGRDYDPLKRLYAVVGNPCDHSLSPPLFQRLFSEYGINAYYTRICTPNLGEVMRQVRRLDLKGLSVTIPFKEEIMAYLNECDEDATKIGAVNTVVFCGSRAYGSNTDWSGIREPLAHHESARAVVIGAGGAAAAAVYALLDLGMEVTVLNRTLERAEALAARFGCMHGPLREFSRIKPEVIVHATPLGMHGEGNQLRKDQLSPRMTVFDLVYTPPDTPLIRAARAAGCEAIPGTEMFVRQACAQFTRFTGIDVPPGMVRGMLL